MENKHPKILLNTRIIHEIKIHESKKSEIALIPARLGSKRLPGKNIKLLKGAPLIAYSIVNALNSNLFDEVIVSTDSELIAEIAIKWGAKVPALRPSHYARDSSADIEWVQHSVDSLISASKNSINCIAILRPTSPLRSSATIVNAFKTFQVQPELDSLRAMEVTNKHPGKMWKLDENNYAAPFMSQVGQKIPTHDRPTQSLEKLWVQNASLELFRFASLQKNKTISGKKILGFTMPGLEGFDINTQSDWDFLEFLISKKPHLLVELS
jgi:N-acylneuraminate cytidylyltransferase